MTLSLSVAESLIAEINGISSPSIEAFIDSERGEAFTSRTLHAMVTVSPPV